MSRLAKTIFFPLAALLTCAPTARGQRDPAPFISVAVMAGPQGFARPPLTSGMVGGYFYAPWGNALVGAQAGSAVISPGVSRAIYGMGTIGVPTARGARWQSYPFLGIGAGILRAGEGSDVLRPVFGVGIGADVGVGDAGMFTLGSRVGYITRSAADDESIAYLTLSLGVGGRDWLSP